MKKYIAEEIYPKSQTGKCIVYFNMSHHYRRIYTAKPCIDTNLTKRTQPQFCCSSPDVFNFVKRNCVKKPLLMTPRHKTCTKEKEPKFFKPKILETQTESKLKSLPVYQAPQRIVTTKAIQTEADQKTPNEEVEETTEANKLEADSNNLEQPQVEIASCKQKEIGSARKTSEPEESSKFRRPLDKSTVMFLKDITDEILRKGIYSNRSLEKLFTHHISKNKYSLPKDLMEKEVMRLKKELEIPVENEKAESENVVADEEALSALDSLFLPSDIRDKVASSLGLIRKCPPLPSPRDSFTGSLVLTSMSEKQDVTKTHNKPNDVEEGDSDVEDEADDNDDDDDSSSKETVTSNNSSKEPSTSGKTNEVIEENVEDENKSVHNTMTIQGIVEKKNSKESEEENIEKENDDETSSELSSIHTESD